MGWLDTYKPKGEGVTEFLIRAGSLRWTSDTHSYEVLDSALVKLKTHYAAIKRTNLENGLYEVFATITLIRMHKSKNDDYNFLYKDMDETVGSYEAECPERILKLLTPTQFEYAIEWRKRCWARIDAKKARPKIVVGTRLRYGGNDYTVSKCLGRRGYEVNGCCRMKTTQAARSEILTGD